MGSSSLGFDFLLTAQEQLDLPRFQASSQDILTWPRQVIRGWPHNYYLKYKWCMTRVKTSSSGFFECSVSCFKAAHLYSHPPAFQERKTAHPSGPEIDILLSLKHKQQRNPSPLVCNCQFNLAIFSKSLLWILWRCQHIHYGLCFLLSQPLCSGNTHLVPLPVSKRKTALMKSRPHLSFNL